MGRKPKGEDPADKAARLRERRMTEVERQKSTEESAAGLAADIRSIYGQRTGSRTPSTPYAPKTPVGGVMNLDRLMRQMVGLK